MSDELKPIYDFNFICLSFNLIPIFGGKASIAPGAITDIRYDEEYDRWRITLHGGTTYTLSHFEMAELEAAIKQRAEDSKIIQREMLKQQLTAQYEVGQEIQNGIQRAAGIIDTGKGKRRH
jgi:hypothetical protein